ncbi:Uncharacterized protein TPAR_06514 [Tolypocladium paradoxum]|uniref:Uncharacterized protein n=1 Tax=Tolypocladium paradoxum TaxID=94208 RepID=A0A2S4KSW7_9HYPO|nr:Uncharacterized protein TPAR_06514 [Tolypocladium paradoxum]
MIPPRYLRAVQSPRAMTLSEWEPTPARRSFDFEVMIKQVAKLPGVRCPKCYAKGIEVWVIPGKSCRECGTPCG